MSGLPYDIQACIIDTLALRTHRFAHHFPRDVKHALLNLCIACKSFHPLATKHLYSRVSLTTVKLIGDYIESVRESSHIRHLECLQLRVWPNFNGSQRMCQTIAELLSFIKSCDETYCPRLRVLHWDAPVEELETFDDAFMGYDAEPVFHILHELSKKLGLEELIIMAGEYNRHTPGLISGYQKLQRAVLINTNIDLAFAKSYWEIPWLDTLVLLWPARVHEDALTALLHVPTSFKKTETGTSRYRSRRRVIFLGEINAFPTSYESSSTEDFEFIRIEPLLTHKDMRYYAPYLVFLDWFRARLDDETLWNLDSSALVNWEI